MHRHQLIACLLLLTCLAGARSASGHALDQGYIFLQVDDTALQGRVEMTLADINQALGLSLPEGEAATLEAIQPHLEQIRRYVSQRVKLTFAGSTPSLPLTDVALLHTSFASFVQLRFAYEDLEQALQTIDVDYSILFDLDPDHRGFLVVESNWKTGTFDNEANFSLVFEPGREQQALDLSDGSTLRGFMNMVRLGTHHIWIGIDHILFLLALLLPAVVQRQGKVWVPVDSFRTALINVVMVVTIFTVAHTITLSLAALNAISLSSRLVESVIALSIAIAALNIFVPIFEKRIWLVVFVFGLFHGFGFASVLSEIGIPPSYMVHSLLGFNVGVELGQLAIVIGLFPVLYFTGKSMSYTRYVLPATTVCLIVVSLYWFTERAFLIDLPAGAIVNKLIALGS